MYVFYPNSKQFYIYPLFTSVTLSLASPLVTQLTYTLNSPPRLGRSRRPTNFRLKKRKKTDLENLKEFSIGLYTIEEHDKPVHAEL